MLKFKNKWVLFIFLLLGLILYPFLVSSQNNISDQAEILYKIAYKKVGHIPKQHPIIYLISQKEIDELVCKRQCGVKAAQIENSIYLVDTLDMTNPMDVSILLHELVHFVQWDQYGSATDCEDYHNREVQAYQIQFDMLARLGIRPPSVSIPICV